MKSAELVLVDIKKMPKTHEELKNWVINKSRDNYLITLMLLKMFKTLLLVVLFQLTSNQSGHSLPLQHLILFQKNLNYFME